LADVTDPAQVSDRLIDREAMARDASHFLLTPAAVVIARHATDVAAVMRAADRLGVAVTFRSGGTSLSGQASTDGVLLDTRRWFRGVEVLDGGHRVRCQPGATVRSVNAHLAGYRRAIGPDPASESACTVGGVIADNSAGMACGIESNSYRTLESVVAVLPDGTVVDTSARDADERFAAIAPDLHRGLALLRDRIRGDARSVAVISHQFSMKNTMGYSINAFVDAERPADILTKLLVGSEGTLGFVASATFRTVPVHPHAAAALLVFPEIARATDAIEPLLAAGARTLELMDARSLRVCQADPRADAAVTSLDVGQHTALLVEARAETADELCGYVTALTQAAAELRLAVPVSFATDQRRRAALWTMRKGLYAAVAGARPIGTTALLEDVAVPVPNLTTTTEALSGLLTAYGHDDAVIFGHAKDGNLHFMINPSFADASQVQRYERFTDDLVDLVLGQHGTLKAEHGTGRMMAPYLRRQYGDELYRVMCEVKRLFDPHGVLNPGIIINDNPRVHLADLKISPPVDPAVDRCVDCGYCEPVCPSRDLTTTPRQRIALLRGMAAARARGELAAAEEVAGDYDYAAVQTCATDSLCLTACPVSIDTGAVMKGLRARRHNEGAQRAAATVARHWGPAVTLLRAGLRAAEAVPAQVLTVASTAARQVVGEDWVPLAGADLPGPGRRRRAAAPPGARVVLFPSCVGSMFGPRGTGDEGGAAAAFARLAERAGRPVAIPEGIGALCCGTPWASKGLTDGYEQAAAATFGAIWRTSRGGRLPVACEASSCSHGLVELLERVPERLRSLAERIEVVDSVTFTRRELLPRLDVRRRLPAVALHPTCAGVHLGGVEDLRAVAAACAEEVVVPLAWGCCGFAGDRGMLHPELTASATAAQVAELAGRTFDAYVSSNRTCEMGMSRATGQPYEHVLELLDRLTR